VTALEDEAAGLVFGAIYREIGVKDDENGKNFKLFLTLDTKLSEEEEESK